MTISDFQIQSQKLHSIEFTSNPFFKNNTDNPIDISILSNVKINRLSNNSAEVILHLLAFKDKDINDVPFKADIINTGIFTWDNKINNEDYLQKLLNENAPSVLMANIRSIIGQLTAYSGYGSYIIPLLDFRKTPNKIIGRDFINNQYDKIINELKNKYTNIYFGYEYDKLSDLYTIWYNKEELDNDEEFIPFIFNLLDIHIIKNGIKDNFYVGYSWYNSNKLKRNRK